MKRQVIDLLELVLAAGILIALVFLAGLDNTAHAGYAPASPPVRCSGGPCPLPTFMPGPGRSIQVTLPELPTVTMPPTDTAG